MIYIASKVKHAERWRAVASMHPVSSTWIYEAGNGETSDFDHLWRRCMAEAASSNALVIYREPDEILKGAWIEMGIAMAAGVPVHAVGIEEFTVAKYSAITHHRTMGAAVAAALDEPARKKSFTARAHKIITEAAGQDQLGWSLYDHGVVDLAREADAALSTPSQAGDLGAVKALAEITTRTENFWAFIQGEYGVKLSSEDQDDHNVYEFFSALETASTILSALSSSPVGEMVLAERERCADHAKRLLAGYDTGDDGFGVEEAIRSGRAAK